jgi:hypothetical protein
VLLAAPVRAAATAGPPPIPTETVAICREIRRRHKEVRALVSYEMSLEGAPGHSAAEQRAVAAEEAFWQFCDALAARPIRSWDDVLIRAEVARACSQFAIDDLPAWCSPEEGNNRDARTIGALLAAAIQMGGIGRLGLDV